MNDREAKILKALESLSSDDLRFIWKTCADGVLMTEEIATYIWCRMLDNVTRYGPKDWCEDIDVSMDHFLFFCENVDTMIQETDWSIYGKQEQS